MNVTKPDRQGLMGRLAIFGTTLIWGTSFVVLKNALDSISTLYILAFRFTGAALLMLLLGFRHLKELDRGYLRGGLIMGLVLFFSYVFQTYGLVYTTPGKNAFLTTVYCIIVPFLAWGMKRRRPDRFNLIAACLCIVGIGLVSLDESLTMGLGDGLTLVCGLFYALHIIFTAEYSAGRSAVLLSLVQFAVCGAVSWAAALLFAPFPTGVGSGAVFSVVYLCVMCTGVCFLLQTIGQKYTPPAVVAIMLTLESVFGVVFSVLLGEQLTLRLVAGFGLIFTAVVLSEVGGLLLRRRVAGE